jgi:type IV pilus assembly protein PilW
MTRMNIRSQRQRGFSLIDVMVGIVIALIAVLVIYQVFDISEGIKRNATGAGDAQQNGLLSTFMMVLQGSNAGANIAVSGEDLDVCPFGDGSNLSDVRASLRPFPVIVTDSGDDAVSDSFVVNYGAAERLVTTVGFKSVPVTFDSTDDYLVQSPLGFKRGDVIVLISGSGVGSGAGKCTSSVINADVDAADSDGYVTLKHSAPADVSQYGSSSTLLNIGSAPHRVRYDVDGDNCTTNSCTLRSQELFYVSGDGTAATDIFKDVNTPVPVANNVVLMKVQYGLADPATGYLQKWVKATSDGGEDWRPSVMLDKSYVELSRIKALRIALIVRSESYDKCAYADKCPDPTTNAFSYSLFSQCDDIPCPDPITGTLDPTPGSGNFRYRVYETDIPLRNAVWNLHKAT